MQFIKDAKLWAGVKLRERKERAEERRADRLERAAREPHGAPSESLIAQVKLGAWGAYIALMWFLWERVLHVSEAQFETLRITNFLWWESLTLSLHFPLIVGYVFVVLTVPYIAKFAIPMMVTLSFREHPIAKLWSIFITILVSVVLISGTATVGGMAVVESERESAVAVEQVQTGRAVLESRIASREGELRSMMENRNAYLAQAASVGAAEWQRSYIDQTSAGDPQRERIVRALGAARSADAVRADIQTLRDQLAQSTAVAAVSSEVTTARSAPIAGILGWLNAFWILLLAVVMDIACLFLPWLAETLQQKRNRVMGQYGEAIRSRWDLVEDKRAEGNVARERQRRDAYDVAEAVMAEGGDPRWAADLARSASSPKPNKVRYTDNDTGDEIEESIVKAHKRKRVLKRGEVNHVEIRPDIPPDETGVAHDGGERQATSAAADGLGERPKGDMHKEEPAEPYANNSSEAFASRSNGEANHASEKQDGDKNAEQKNTQDYSLSEEPTIPEELDLIPDEEIFAEDVELETPAPISASNEQPQNEPAEQNEQADEQIVAQDETPEREEPETREDRMLPSSVAAE
jgi:hypothetical protein